MLKNDEVATDLDCESEIANFEFETEIRVLLGALEIPHQTASHSHSKSEKPKSVILLCAFVLCCALFVGQGRNHAFVDCTMQ